MSVVWGTKHLGDEIFSQAAWQNEKMGRCQEYF